MRLALITPSFSRDRDLCVELCRSIDETDRDGLEHVIVVPRADLAMFRSLAGGRRRVVAQEEILPAWLFRVPLPTLVSIPGVWRKRLRKIWLTPSGVPVRGWLLQQVLKMSADRMSDADGYVFIDSDAVMVRPFGADTFVREGRMPLPFTPNAIDHSFDQYTRWQDVACDLTGVPRFPFTGDNYIATVVCWRRDRLLGLQQRIEEVTGKGHQAVLLRQRHLSEYVVYGIYCRRALDGEDGHYVQARSICHEDWDYETATPEGMDAFVRGLRDDQIAVLIQSTNEWPVERRRAAIADIKRHAGLA